MELEETKTPKLPWELASSFEGFALLGSSLREYSQLLLLLLSPVVSDSV